MTTAVHRPRLRVGQPYWSSLTPSPPARAPSDAGVRRTCGLCRANIGRDTFGERVMSHACHTHVLPNPSIPFTKLRLGIVIGANTVHAIFELVGDALLDNINSLA